MTAKGACPRGVRPLVLTMGEPGGIGGEIALKAWRQLRRDGGPAFFALDDLHRLKAEAARCGLADVPVLPIEDPATAAAAMPTGLPVLHRPLPAPCRPGKTVPETAAAVIAAIAEAVTLARNGVAAAVVTNPIHKSALYAAGFRYPGHTEFLARLAAGPDGRAPRPVMMLAIEGLRVVPVTVHIPLVAVPSALTREAIVATGRIVAADLGACFGLPRPRLAVAGLNPHAGESGTLGLEDRDIIAPAITDLRALDIDARGPRPADTLFHARARQDYDAVLCMYHDQALIPLKTLDFDKGVNVTLGLPFIRTSPDHGTALDIAGQGLACESSLVAALRTAAEMAAARGQDSHALADRRRGM